MKVIYEDNHILVIEKPINVPMQEDSSEDMDVIRLAKEYLKNKYNKPGNVYCGLVHRLDRPVGGVVVLAKTSKAASRLSDSVRTNKMNKKYCAVVVGVLPNERVLKDYLVKDDKTNTSRITSEKYGKYSELSYKVLDRKDNLSFIQIDLKTGRSHQIRVQFASRNCPLYGDQRYNKDARVGQQIALWATELSFPHPTTQEILSFESNLPNTEPWKKFI
ncbi:MAG: RNA pseudouridine synthase [Erysipelotrichaceae bacterium]|nr:RNA pseudouridine synthase [Erysipelotrichaceae bacterium]